MVLDAGADPDELRRSLVALPGIGPWTAEYVAMRALRDPDAFMPTDLGIRRGAAARGLPEDPGGLVAHAEAWRPWRSYAMAHLWALPAAGTPRLSTRRRERTCRMTTTTSHPSLRLTRRPPRPRVRRRRPHRDLAAQRDPAPAPPRRRRPAGAQGDRQPARGVLRRRARRLRRADGARRDRLPAPGLGRALPHSLRETISYGELARRVGRPKGPRAVGQANGRNPIPIIVPCHRVLASNGIGGYGGGLPMKRAAARRRGRHRLTSPQRAIGGALPKVRRWKPPGVCSTRSI